MRAMYSAVIPIGTTHADDVSPSFMGDSVGRWEGNTFVVDVVSFKPGGWLTGGLVTSDALHLTERYTRVDRDQLNYEVTIEDAKMLTKPFTQRTTLMLRDGARLREYSCAENNMDPGVYEKMLKDPTSSASSRAAGSPADSSPAMRCTLPNGTRASIAISSITKSRSRMRRC